MTDITSAKSSLYYFLICTLLGEGGGGEVCKKSTFCTLVEIM